MGLDMYLYKCPKVGLNFQQIRALSNYFEWEDRQPKDPDGNLYPYEEWLSAEQLNVLLAPFLRGKMKKYMKTTYPCWDLENSYKQYSMIEQVGYWRKASAIHRFFVVNVQNGQDDCGHYAVKRETLADLVDRCERILSNNGLTINSDVPSDIDLSSDNDANTLLPTTDGYFFGGGEYTDYYVHYLIDTIKSVRKILAETDFETEVVYYHSSW